VKREWRVSEVQAVASLTSRVKTSHVPSMFAVSLVILDDFRKRPAMLPCFLRHFRLQIMVGNFVATFSCLSWV
jgi:hypothetical protein